MPLPAPTELASVLAAARLLSGRSAAAEEAVHLVDENPQHPVRTSHVLETGERVRGGQDAVGVDARLAVQAVPHDRRQVEQHRLRTHVATVRVARDRIARVLPTVNGLLMGQTHAATWR